MSLTSIIGKYLMQREQFAPCLHLLKVNYPMNDESTLRDVECFFFGLIDKIFGFK